MKIRIDFATVTFDFSDAPATPARGSARRTADGYLEVDAYLARDGLLRYSDGRTSWLEYRPREELDAAAASWHLAPVTDDHPPTMVDASNYSQYARGLVIDRPTVEDVDGVAYLRARIQVRDAVAIEKIDTGKRQLSIGFWSDVKLQRGTVGGKTYDAIQTALRGNHVALVDQGRAGPAVRVLLDAANCAVHSDGSSVLMRKVALSAAFLAVYTAKARAHRDEAGMPTTMAKIVGPDGTELDVPTWLAAIVEKAMEEHGAASAPPAATSEPAAEAASVPATPPNPDEEEEQEQPMTPDQINALVASGSRKRARLERLSVMHKVDAAKLDADDIELARALVTKCMPKVKCDKLEGAALDALVDACAELEPPTTAPANPFEVRAPITDAAQDEWYERQAKILAANGVTV